MVCEILDLPADRFDLVHQVARGQHVVAHRLQQAELRADVGLGAGRMRILEDLQRLRELLPRDGQLHRIRAGGGQQGQTSAGRAPFGADFHPRRVDGTRPQTDVAFGRRAQVPPHPVHAGVLRPAQRPHGLSLVVKNRDHRIAGWRSIQVDT